MKDRGWMEPIVERVVGQVLDRHVAELRQEIVRRVAEEVEAEAAKEPGSLVEPAPQSAELASAVAQIQLGTSQREILRALLDACRHYAPRLALFVVKGGQATGWQGSGFAESDGVKDFHLDVNASALSRSIRERTPVRAQTSELDAQFLERFGSPADKEAWLLPLVLKDKVAALLYADAGTDSNVTLDADVLQLLVLATSAWLEVNALRKQAHKEPAELSEKPRAVSVEAPAYSDPFAVHIPSHARAAAASTSPAVEAEHMQTEQSVALGEAEPSAGPLPIAPPPGAAEGAPGMALPTSAEEQETHRKAQRFARLLVDEIKLYNQAKVAEGRKNKDLYDRLKETIEKSRSTYQKRYGKTVASAASYFEDELIRSLAEDDVSTMGANFRH